MTTVMIIGAGMAGLSCAHRLTEAGADVIVVDKGRAVGGRMATRTVGEARFDHGAQHFSARSPSFRALVADLFADGAVDVWFESQSAADPARGIEPRHVGRAGMRRIPEALARGLDVRTSTEIVSLEVADGRIAGFTHDGPATAADAIVITSPLPQTRDLLHRSGIPVPDAVASQLTGRSYHPCLAVMAVPEGIPGAGHLTGSGSVAWVADNRAKGTSDAPSVTIHAGSEYSVAHLEDDPADWSVPLVAEAASMLGTPLTTARTHRWRYSQPVNPLEVGALAFAHEGTPVVLAGDLFAGDRVEAAYLSGREAAARLGA